MRAPDFWQQRTKGERLLTLALLPVGQLYGSTIAHKAAHARPYRSTAKVICVGNLTVGGTGKTPVTISIVQALKQRQLRVCILTRGYGRRSREPLIVDPKADTASQVGDEAVLLAKVAQVIVSADRAAGAKLAETARAAVIVMDDGHQNFSLAKDLSLVVVDSEEGFGNGRILPAGPLREPVDQGLERADAVIVMGGKQLDVPGFKGPVLRAALKPATSPTLLGRHVLAFAGIGRPEKFFRTLRELGPTVVATHAFADHHVYTSAEMTALRDESCRKDAKLITTEKDFARLPIAERQNIECVAVQAVFEDPAALKALLDRVATVSSGAQA